MAMARCHNLRDQQVLINHLPAQNIEVLSIIIMVLILHNRHSHITLMIHPLLNHLCLAEHNNIHPIIRMDSIFFIYRRDDYDDDFEAHHDSIWK